MQGFNLSLCIPCAVAVPHRCLLKARPVRFRSLVRAWIDWRWAAPSSDYRRRQAEETAPVDEFLWDGEYEAKEIDPDVNADLAASFLEVATLRLKLLTYLKKSTKMLIQA